METEWVGKESQRKMEMTIWPFRCHIKVKGPGGGEVVLNASSENFHDMVRWKIRIAHCGMRETAPEMN